MSTRDEFEAAVRWRNDAILDGWTVEPIYPSEGPDVSCRLTRDGYVAMVVTRHWPNKGAYYVSMGLWGPDGMSIAIPVVYDWETIRVGIHRCLACGKDKVQTHRAGFAYRVCADCLPAAQAKYEFPGWTN